METFVTKSNHLSLFFIILADNLERPPPYNLVAPVSSSSPSNFDPLGGGNTLYVQCRVCQHIINVQQGTTSRVVKCNNCQEATVSL